MSTLEAALKLRDALHQYSEQKELGQAAYILNPLDYAWEPHATYIKKFAPAGHHIEALLLGMNPGPWGMAQTGIPFGTSNLVRDFLEIEGEVKPPPRTHPKRPIIGLNCETQEVSGTRLWGAIRDCFQTPEAFFSRFYVANYCPLAFQSETGSNITPDKLPGAEWQSIVSGCEDHLAHLIQSLKPKTVIGVGKWAENEAKRVIASRGLATQTATILHPSPASPAANRGWKEAALRQLAAIGHPW